MTVEQDNKEKIHW